MVDQFRSLGGDISSFYIGVAALFGVAIGLLAWRKKHVPFYLLGMEASFVISGLLHIPSALTSPLMFAALMGGIQLDLRRSRPTGSRVTATALLTGLTVFCTMACCNFFWGAKLTLTPDSLTSSRTGAPTVLARSGLQVNVVQHSESGRRMWQFDGPEGEATLYGDDVYLDSSWHWRNGDEVGRIVSMWAKSHPDSRKRRP